jgi:thioredoxin reductase (NADPH)
MGETIAIYGAHWCPDCRRAKRFLSDQRIAYEWHDIETDPEGIEIVRERNAGNNTIPTIVFPDGSHLAEPSNEELAEKLGLQRSALQHVYDLIIVGGGPTGLTTGIYAARENLETLIVDSKGLGGQAGVTERLDNHPGFPEGIGGAELADRIVRQAERHGVETLQALSVTGITDEGHHELDVETATGQHYHARAVLIATGSSYRRTGADGEEALIGAGIHFCATCDGPFYEGADELMVIGGGNSGHEEGLFLTQFAERVCVVELSDELRGSRMLRDKVRNHPKMEVLTNHAVRSFAPKNDGSGKLGVVVVEDRATHEQREHRPAAVFVFIGLDPNTAFLEGVVALDEAGFVTTDASSMTSVEGVFAAGDVRAGSTKQLAFAVGDGAAAAIQIRRYLDRVEAMSTI